MKNIPIPTLGWLWYLFLIIPTQAWTQSSEGIPQHQVITLANTADLEAGSYQKLRHHLEQTTIPSTLGSFPKRHGKTFVQCIIAATAYGGQCFTR